jgi:hypothetical protein
MYLHKVKSRKTFFENYFFVGVLKFNDENSRIWDPLVRVMDPRIRIQIHTKMSWIWNTDHKASLNINYCKLHITNVIQV